MSTEEDFLLKTLGSKSCGTRSDRLHYATGEMLGADDFQSEQLYHRRQLAMALRFLYGSGTLAGLKVLVVPEEDPDNPGKLSDVQIQVNPGLAIDRAGRLVEVPVPVSLRLKKWFSFMTSSQATGNQYADKFLENGYNYETGTVGAEVFLSFYQSKRGWTPAFASGPFDALDASQPNRIRDAYELRLVLRKTSNPVPFDPWEKVQENATKEKVQEAIFNAWDKLKIPEVSQGDFYEIPSELDDPTSIRLARLSVPVAIKGNPPKLVEDLDWTLKAWKMDSQSEDDNTTNVDNTVRSFIVPPALLRRLHNL